MPGGPTPKAMDSTQREGLQVQMGAPTAGAPADGSLRCFVGGQFVGMTTLDDCARRNGVATDALDVRALLDAHVEIARQQLLARFVHDVAQLAQRARLMCFPHVEHSTDGR